MLPAGLSREILGKRTRRDAPVSQTAQLVGRSRNERLLDRIYNRQSRVLRDAERQKRREALKAARIAAAARARDMKKEEGSPKTEPDAKRIKVEGEEESSSAGPPPKVVETGSVITSLIRFASSKVKLPKVTKLALQLVEAGYLDKEPAAFLDLLASLAYSPAVAVVPEVRPSIITLCRKIRSAFLSEEDTSPSLPTSLEQLPVDPDALDAVLSQTVSHSDWVKILCITPLWHNLLMTDDTYQFHQALVHIDAFTKGLPSVSDVEVVSVTDQEREALEARRVVATTVKQEEDAALPASTASSRPPYLPTRAVAYEIQREAISQLLGTVHAYAKVRWARAAVTQYFQYLYLHRAKLFHPSDRTRVEQYQASIWSGAVREGRVHDPLLVGQSARPIKDGREDKIVAVHGAAVWSAKQAGL